MIAEPKEARGVEAGRCGTLKLDCVCVAEDKADPEGMTEAEAGRVWNGCCIWCC